jgi:ABC-2 type transport system ATP-binding protein
VLELVPMLDQRPRTFSLGQRMRANLAAAVLPAPPVLFLDEPTIGLDVEAKAVVREFLAALNSREGTTVLLTTHDLDDMTALARRLMVIDHGRLVYDGTVDGLRSVYGAERVLVVDLRERPAGAFAVEGARLLRSEGHRHWLAFPRSASAAEVIGRVLARYDVADLTLEEPDLEDVVRRIYRGEVSLPSG